MSNFKFLISNPSWDIIAVLVFVSAGFLYGLFSGRSRLVSILIATYISAFLFQNFQYLDFLSSRTSVLETFFLRTFSFFVVLVLVSLLIGRLFSRREWETRAWWQIFLLSFLEVGLLLSLILQLFPAGELFKFSPLVEKFFVGETAFSVWLLAPLIALWLISR